MVILGNDSDIDKSEKRKIIKWRPETEAAMLGNAADGIGILERVPNIFPHREKLRSKRIELPKNNNMG